MDRYKIELQATAKLCSACFRTASTCSRLTPGNQSRKSSTRAPSSRFAKRACTGTRVPLKTQAPLTFPGVRSTTGHWFQSSTRKGYVIEAAEGKLVADFPTSRSGRRRRGGAACGINPHFSQMFVARRRRVAWMRVARRFRDKGIVDTMRRSEIVVRRSRHAAIRRRSRTSVRNAG